MKTPNVKTITIENVDVELLRKQRNHLLTWKNPTESTDGIINLLDAMLDIADGIPPIVNRSKQSEYPSSLPELSDIRLPQERRK